MLFLEGCLTLVCLQFLIFATGLSHVEGKTGLGGTSQEWGYVTVRPGAKMFWWLFHTTSKDVTDPYGKPLLIWLEGGPGAAGTGYAIFDAIGPIDWQLNRRRSTWVNNYNVLFVDNPIGAGFSYIENNATYSETNAQIASDLLEFVRGFYSRAPKWLPVPVYILSQSYGGKMAVEFALLWHQEQKARRIKSNLRGVMLMNSWISPMDSVLSYGPFIQQTGLVDKKGFTIIEEQTNYTRLAVQKGDWWSAMFHWMKLNEFIGNVTSNANRHNILGATYWSEETSESSTHTSPTTSSKGPVGADRFENFMNTRIKSALNVKGNWTYHNWDVYQMLSLDFMRPVTDKVERLLNETDIEVVVVNSQLDMLTPTSGALKWIENLKWRNSIEWQAATRHPLIVNNMIEGYFKQYGNLKMYWVHRAGHMVLTDNRAASWAIVQSMTAKWIK